MSETTIGLQVLLTYALLVLLTYALLIIGILSFFRGSHCWDDDDLRQESMASGDSGWAPSLDDGMLGPRDMTRWPRRDWHPDSSR